MKFYWNRNCSLRVQFDPASGVGVNKPTPFCRISPGAALEFQILKELETELSKSSLGFRDDLVEGHRLLQYHFFRCQDFHFDTLVRKFFCD